MENTDPFSPPPLVVLYEWVQKIKKKINNRLQWKNIQGIGVVFSRLCKLEIDYYLHNDKFGPILLELTALEWISTHNLMNLGSSIDHTNGVSEKDFTLEFSERVAHNHVCDPIGVIFKSNQINFFTLENTKQWS